MPFELLTPSEIRLPFYTAALRRGWSPNTNRPEAAQEQLAAIEADAAGFLAAQDHRAGPLPEVTLPDGSTRPRIPGFTLWMWDGEFCGSINARWLPGTVELPDHVMGHIGYGVVPWKRGRGLATRALALLLARLGPEGLPLVELTTEEDNAASRRVIEANGGVVVERFEFAPEFGGGPGLRYRIEL